MSFAALPPEAQKLLETFPEKKITLELVLSRAIQSSDSFQEIWSNRFATQASLLASEAASDWILNGYAEREWNQNQPLSLFDVSRSNQTAFGVGVSKAFSLTGTQLSLGLDQLDYDAVFPNFSTGGTSQLIALRSQASIGLKQPLLKNAFGQGVRANQEAGAYQTQARTLALQEGIEDWALSLIKIYYQAWSMQARVRVAQESLKRRLRLESIIAKKAKRGTAETPDLLQVSAAVKSSRVDLLNANQNLTEVWRALVITLKLPKDWLSIDPSDVPMVPDQGFLEIQKNCQHSFIDEKNSTKVERLKLEKQAADRSFEQATQDLWPDLSLAGKLVTNAVNQGGQFTSRWGDTFSTQNPRWSLGLTLSFPLGRYTEKAAYVSAQSLVQVKEAQLAQSQSELQVKWMNGCLGLKRWVDAVGLYQSALQDQLRRVVLEERRYEQGRVSPTAVIQAGDDANSAEWALMQTEAELRVSAWSLEQIAGRLNQTLKHWIKVDAP